MERRRESLIASREESERVRACMVLVDLGEVVRQETDVKAVQVAIRNAVISVSVSDFDAE